MLMESPREDKDLILAVDAGIIAVQTDWHSAIPMMIPDRRMVSIPIVIDTSCRFPPARLCGKLCTG